MNGAEYRNGGHAAAALLSNDKDPSTKANSMRRLVSRTCVRLQHSLQQAHAACMRQPAALHIGLALILVSSLMLAAAIALVLLQYKPMPFPQLEREGAHLILHGRSTPQDTSALLQLFQPHQQPQPHGSAPFASAPYPLSPHMQQLLQFVHRLKQAGHEANCRYDPTLPLAPPKHERFFIGLALADAEHQLPHQISQLLTAVELLRGSRREGSVFVSVYESGSSDATPHWLEVLRYVLAAADVPHRIVAGTRRGLSKQADRIPFLARVRNRVMEPLWPRDQWAPMERDTLMNVAHKLPEGGFRADRLVLINDVYFCASDVLRLVQHDAHIACGMDYLGPYGMEIHRMSKKGGDGSGSRFNSSVAMMAQWTRPGRDIGDLPFKGSTAVLYDTWVARDVNGRWLYPGFPHAHARSSVERVRRGLPFAAYCCWNGMVVAKAEPFHSGLRFRSHTDNECSASECSLLCDDYWRIYGRPAAAGQQPVGRGPGDPRRPQRNQQQGQGQGQQARALDVRVVIDPGVRLAYNAGDQRIAWDPRQPIPTTSWREAQLHPINWVAAAAEAGTGPRGFSPASVDCCEMMPWNRQDIDMDNCVTYDTHSRNFTADAMRAGFRPSLVGFRFDQSKNSSIDPAELWQR